MLGICAGTLTTVKECLQVPEHSGFIGYHKHLLSVQNTLLSFLKECTNNYVSPQLEIEERWRY